MNSIVEISHGGTEQKIKEKKKKKKRNNWIKKGNIRTNVKCTSNNYKHSIVVSLRKYTFKSIILHFGGEKKKKQNETNILRARAKNAVEKKKRVERNSKRTNGKKKGKENGDKEMSDRILISMRHGRDLIVCKKAEQREILFLKTCTMKRRGR